MKSSQFILLRWRHGRSTDKKAPQDSFTIPIKDNSHLLLSCGSNESERDLVHSRPQNNHWLVFVITILYGFGEIFRKCNRNNVRWISNNGRKGYINIAVT